MEGINELRRRLAEENYIADEALTTTLWIALKLGRPLLIEGAAGVGKTEVAKVAAQALGRELIRMQCYEGLDESKALYEWNYQKQLLSIQVHMASQDREELTRSLFSDEYLLERPLLHSIRSEKPVVLLIDEIDKADEEVESFLLQALGEKEITINDLGTFQLANDLIVILTSNSQRSLLDETKDRCLFLYIPYPSVEREIEIVKSRLPGAEDETVSKIVKIVHEIRNLNLMKKPSVRGTVDWVRSVSSLGTKNFNKSLEDSIGVAIKTESDKKRVLKDIIHKKY